MEIIVGKTAGFCGGVKNAVTKAEEAVAKEKKLYCLGELVHNEQVTKKLEEQGMKTIKNIEEAECGSCVIFRAHGEPQVTYEMAKQRNINVLDLSCPKVLLIHKMAEEYVKRGYYIIYIAEKGHPETIGTFGYCGENAIIVSCVAEIEEAVQAVTGNKIAIIAQTTFSMDGFDNIVKLIKESLPKNIIIEVNKTICDATKQRQLETEKIAKQVECMIIIGGKKSSNTQKLYDISKKNCKKAYFIQTLKDLLLEDVKKSNKIGIMAGASTPAELIEEVKKTLNIGGNNESSTRLERL